MGEFSEFFEDFPEQNPGNYVGDRFDPKGAEALRRQEARVAQESAQLRDTINKMIEDGKKRAKLQNRTSK